MTAALVLIGALAIGGVGVVHGYTDHCFLPERTATRAESVAVIHRALGEPDPPRTAPLNGQRVCRP